MITRPNSRHNSAKLSPPGPEAPRKGVRFQGSRSQLGPGDTRKDGRLVTVVRGLYVRFQRLIHEAAKFGVVGIVGVFITNGGYALLHDTFGLGPVTATTIATIVATAVSYVANRYWSFRHRERTSVAREGVIFFVLNGIEICGDLHTLGRRTPHCNHDFRFTTLAALSDYDSLSASFLTHYGRKFAQ